MKSINNVVDITNYVMLERANRSTHFDFDRLDGGRIVVRRADSTRSLSPWMVRNAVWKREDLLICDASKSGRACGRDGGKNSEVSEKTTTLLLGKRAFRTP